MGYCRIEWMTTHTPFLSAGYEITMLKGIAGHVHTLIAHISNDDADIRDGNLRHRLGFHGGKPRIDEISPGENGLFLQALISAVGDERLGVLDILWPAISLPAISPVARGLPSLVVMIPTWLSGISRTSAGVTVKSAVLMR